MQQALVLIAIFFAALATGGLIVSWIGLGRAIRTLVSIPGLTCYLVACLVGR
jgi:hypothetical protein